MRNVENRKSILHKFAASAVSLGLILILFSYTNCSSSHDSMLSEDFTSGSSFDTAAAINNLRSGKDEVLMNKCASCHNSGTTNNPLTDITNTDYLKTKGYIVAGSPQTSPLYLDVVDGIMPPASSPQLSAQELATLRDWISAEGGNFNTQIGGPPTDPSPGPVTVATFTQVRAILNQNCVACHRAGANLPRLDVDAVTLRGTIINGMNLVVPNNPNTSRLLQSFSRMAPANPLGVNSAAGNTVRSWINGGAL